MINSDNLAKRKLSMYFGLFILLTVLVIPAYADATVKPTDKGTINVGFSTDPANPNPGDQTQLKISFINKQTNAIQQHIDYKVSIIQNENQVFGIPVTHTAEGSVSIPFQFQTTGTYQVIVEVDGILFQPTPPETASFTVNVASASPNPTSGNKSGCLIATAAFGSELTPQVQFLRNFRDNHILATDSGSSFMTIFNAWYYSFSPYVANYERQQPWLQETVKASIYPLLGILTLSEKGFSLIPGDYGALAAGTIASSMIGAVYFWPFALSVKQVRTTRFNYKIAVYVITSVFAATLGAILTGNEYGLMVTTSLFVLTMLSVSAILGAKLITKFMNRLSH